MDQAVGRGKIGGVVVVSRRERQVEAGMLDDNSLIQMYGLEARASIAVSAGLLLDGASVTS